MPWNFPFKLSKLCLKRLEEKLVREKIEFVQDEETLIDIMKSLILLKRLVLSGKDVILRNLRNPIEGVPIKFQLLATFSWKIVASLIRVNFILHKLYIYSSS